ncbi:acyltransferase family protein [Novosphingobium mangrovi (ex Hu et al. 2023)]|uniref:Acyltransferase n=1 Tax=Novosphingobium mangrovi (ex Hu et al. 2023) TaxID=2930094 RepID=A0ABT0A8E7_9SPHN|nr:acyltransferase [Novosphingobium mangrovi (ex Hu et al. 2023)]MCJ1959475.1 acyltransferase [Novosphingobium mangrovi (ex Hu et al. 2023)]
MDSPFLTRPLSVVLDFARFLAAFLVVVGHSVQLHLYTGPYPFSGRLQHYCVIVFFVLSGLVIATSVTTRPSSLGRYTIARVSRILPVAVPALLFAALSAYLLAGGAHVRIDNSPDDPLLFAERILPPLVFLSAWPGMPAPVWNPPYWSLCYEVWYYAIFALAFFLRSWARVAAVALACLLAGPTLLLLFPVWLMGVALTAAKPAQRLPLRLAPVVLAGCGLCAWGLFQIDMTLLNPLAARLWPEPLKWSYWVLSDLVMGAIMAFCVIALRPLAAWLEAPILRLRGTAHALAGFSFTLYLFHWPLIQLLRSHGIEAGRSPVAWAGLLALVVGLCAMLSLGTERVSPRLRRWMERRFLRPVPLPQIRPASV